MPFRRDPNLCALCKEPEPATITATLRLDERREKGQKRGKHIRSIERGVCKHHAGSLVRLLERRETQTPFSGSERRTGS